MDNERDIWILDSDKIACEFYKSILSYRYRLKFIDSLSHFVDQIKQAPSYPDLTLMELKLNDGYLLNAKAREITDYLQGAPFIVITAMDDVDLIRAILKTEALDYLQKPAGKNLMIAKIETLLCCGSTPRKYTYAKRGSLMFGGIEIPDLTNIQYRIIQTFLKADSNIARKEELFLNVWNGISVSPKTLDVHLCNLRKILSKIGLAITNVQQGAWSLTLV